MEPGESTAGGEQGPWSCRHAIGLLAGGAFHGAPRERFPCIFPLLVIGMLLVGSGHAAVGAARFAGADLAGADLADAETRAAAIGAVMWASTVGSVLGPVVSLAVAGPALEAIGAPEYTGSYLLVAVLFLLAGATIRQYLRPDPLHVAGDSAAAPTYRPPSAADLAFIVRNVGPAIGSAAMALSQAVMVGVMAVASLHMLDGDQSRVMIGLMISLHVTGMYAFSPWVGALVDRMGSPLMIAAGSIQSFIGAELASHTAAGDAAGMLGGMFLIGSGWCFTMVAGSALLTASSPLERRVGVQATADFLMMLTGAAAGVTAGLVVEVYGFHDLSHWAGFLAIAVAAASIWAVIRPPLATP